MIKVAIFEDNRSLREGLAVMIGGTPGFDCVGAFPNCNNLLKNISQANPDVVLMEIVSTVPGHGYDDFLLHYNPHRLYITFQGADLQSIRTGSYSG